MKTMSALAVSALTLAFVATAFSVPADAGRKQCVYMAHNPWSGHMVADGWARAIKLSTACKRARRRCSRELGRKRVKGAYARDCRKLTNLSD